MLSQILKSIFLPVDECHTHALSRDTMHLRLDGQVCFYRWLFCNAVKLQGCISWPVWLLRGINKTAWVAILILRADLLYHSSCASLCHLLMVQHCHFCVNVCFSPPTAPHPPPQVHVIYVTWAGVIFLICTHEHIRQITTAHVTYVTLPGTIKIAQAYLSSAYLYRHT